MPTSFYLFVAFMLYAPFSLNFLIFVSFSPTLDMVFGLSMSYVYNNVVSFVNV